MKITQITIQKRNKKRSNVYIDGNYYCALDNFTVVSNMLKVGQNITEEEISKLQYESECDKALSYSFDYLSKYRKTEKELANKLKDKGYLNNVISYVIDKVKSYNYINDLDYANSYIEFNSRKKGFKLLKYELKMKKGISDEIIDRLEPNLEQEREAILKITEKHFKKIDITRENISKLYKKLLSKGFEYEIIKEIVLEFVGEVENEF